jgi:glycosyltransferase involved in cell wall biosynthesis
MRISLITSLLWGGGAARVLVNMANYWARAGHDVSLFSFEDGSSSPLYAVDKKVKVIFLDIYGYSNTLSESFKNNVRRLFVMRKNLLAERPDVVISFIDTVNVRVIAALFGSGVPIIVSERIHPAHEVIGSVWAGLRRATYPFADALVVQTEEIKRYCERWKAKEVAVIPNSVRVLENTGEAPRLNRPCIVAVGRMARQKNYALLVKAFDKLRLSFPDWALYVVGRREEDAEVQALLRDETLAKRVHFTGQVSNVARILEQTDIYAMTSRYEGFPNALCEAMAAGLPCVATKCQSGPAEIIEDGVNGVLVENESLEELVEALAELMDSPSERERLGARAKELKEKLSEEDVMRLWDELIRKVTG